MNHPDQPDTHSQRLDADAVARLRELDPDGSRGVLERVFKAFESSLVRMLKQLDAQSGAEDAAALASLAHTLKSSSASVGALALARTCAEVEQRLRAGEPGSLAVDIARLRQAGEAALAAVRATVQR